MEMEAMGKQQREEALLRAAAAGNLRLLKKMARWMGSGGQGEAAILAAVEDGQGDRALHLAAGAGRLEVCRYLVEDLRLDVNQLNFIGKPKKQRRMLVAVKSDRRVKSYMQNPRLGFVAEHLLSTLKTCDDHILWFLRLPSHPSFVNMTG